MLSVKNKIELSFVDELCTRCGSCEQSCPSQVFRWKDDTIQRDFPGRCIGCGHCVAACEHGAFLHSELPIGKFDSISQNQPIPPRAIKTLFRERRSCRRFKAESPSDETIAELIEFARHAPSSTNAHNVRYYVFNDPAKLETLKEGTARYYFKLARQLNNPLMRFAIGLSVGKQIATAYRYRIPAITEMFHKTLAGNDRLFYGAPSVIVLTAPGLKHMAAANCNLAAAQILAGLSSLELGGYFNGYLLTALVRDKQFRGALGMNQSEVPGAAIVFGSPASEFHRVPPRKAQRVIWNP